MQPLRRGTIARSAARVPNQTASRLSARSRRQRASSVASIGVGIAPPALLWKTSSRPKASSAASARASAVSGRVTSPGAGRARPPTASISPTTRFAAAGSTSFTTTAAPSAAKRSAVARPIPEPAPVTTAALPASRPAIGPPRAAARRRAHRIRSGMPGAHLEGDRVERLAARAPEREDVTARRRRVAVDRARGAERLAVERERRARCGGTRREQHALARGRDVRVEGDRRAVGRRYDARRDARGVRDGDAARLGPGEEPLAPRRLQPGIEGELRGDDAGRWRGGRARVARVQRIHDREPGGSGARRPRDAAHRIALEVPDPDAHREAAAKADAPVVAQVLARPGLDGAPVPRRERALEAEGHGPARAVREYVRDEEGRLRAHHAPPGARGVVGAHAQRAPRAAVRERAVGVRLLEQRHLGGAEREREAVEGAVLDDPLVAHLAQAVAEGLDADERRS